MKKGMIYCAILTGILYCAPSFAYSLSSFHIEFSGTAAVTVIEPDPVRGAPFYNHEYFDGTFTASAKVNQTTDYSKRIDLTLSLNYGTESIYCYTFYEFNFFNDFEYFDQSGDRLLMGIPYPDVDNFSFDFFDSSGTIASTESALTNNSDWSKFFDEQDDFAEGYMAIWGGSDHLYGTFAEMVVTEITPVPEPSTILLFSVGAIGLFYRRKFPKN